MDDGYFEWPEPDEETDRNEMLDLFDEIETDDGEDPEEEE